jgi:hypothetical protein
MHHLGKHGVEAIATAASPSTTPHHPVLPTAAPVAPALASQAPTDAVLWLDATNSRSVAKDFPLPKVCPVVPHPSVLPNTNVLQLCSAFSASIELPVVSCQWLRFDDVSSLYSYSPKQLFVFILTKTGHGVAMPNPNPNPNPNTLITSLTDTGSVGPGIGIVMRIKLEAPPPLPQGCDDGTSVHNQQWTVLTIGDVWDWLLTGFYDRGVLLEFTAVVGLKHNINVIQYHATRVYLTFDTLPP